MRPPESFKPFVSFTRLVVAIIFAMALLTSSVAVESHKDDQEGTHSPEVGDLMEKLDADFGALVKAALIASVQELVSETPYAAIEKQAVSIAATAKVLPNVEEFRGDNSMLVLSRQLEAAADDLAKAARNKNMDATVKALVAIHGACVRCHEDARF
ncbi:MAG: hypothetical protein OXE44_14480 [Nitrospinae bacterium]|nr:hypothetical protein [Nitrospinota bacterium]